MKVAPLNWTACTPQTTNGSWKSIWISKIVEIFSDTRLWRALRRMRPELKDLLRKFTAWSGTVSPFHRTLHSSVNYFGVKSRCSGNCLMYALRSHQMRTLVPAAAIYTAIAACCGSVQFALLRYIWMGEFKVQKPMRMERCLRNASSQCKSDQMFVASANRHRSMFSCNVMREPSGIIHKCAFDAKHDDALRIAIRVWVTCPQVFSGILNRYVGIIYVIWVFEARSRLTSTYDVPPAPCKLM